MCAYRILVVRYDSGQLERVLVVAPDRGMAQIIAEHTYGEVVEARR